MGSFALGQNLPGSVHDFLPNPQRHQCTMLLHMALDAMTGSSLQHMALQQRQLLTSEKNQPGRNVCIQL